MGKKWCQLYFLFKKMNLEFYSKEKLKKEVLAIVGMQKNGENGVKMVSTLFFCPPKENGVNSVFFKRGGKKENF